MRAVEVMKLPDGKIFATNFPFAALIREDNLTIKGCPVFSQPSTEVTVQNVLTQLDEWEIGAKNVIRSDKDKHQNASTLISTGNLDVLQQRIFEATIVGPPVYLLFGADRKTLLAAAMMQEVCHKEKRNGAVYPCIMNFLVSPVSQLKGVGTQLLKHLVEVEMKLSTNAGYILFAELTSIPFWLKNGFRTCSHPTLTSTCDNVQLMMLKFSRKQKKTKALK